VRLRALIAGVVVLATAAPAAAASAAPGRQGPDGPGFSAPKLRHHLEGRQVTPQPTTWDTDPAIDQAVDALVAQLSNSEKADLATGELNNFYGFYNNPLQRLGIPALTMADGPVGVRIANPSVNGQRATELPSGTSLGATFDPDAAGSYGDLLGDEAFNTGHNVLLGPAVDIARTPLWGRAFEAFGEDPLLMSRLAVSVIRGIQQHPVLATVKHFAVYNQETDRFTISADVDERTLREIYLPPFEAAVREGHVGAAMCAFNRINGVYACGNPLMNDVLKGDFGFRGFVMSDYNATPADTAQAANAGLDQEQPGDQGPGSANFGERLVAAVEAGTVSQARLDDMAGRVLRPMIGMGLLETQPQVNDLREAEHGQRARQLAVDGMVLLKNRRDLLPLRGGPGGSIAVIGPDADNASAQGGGSSVVRPTHTVSPLEGIRARAGASTSVEYAPGTDGISEGDLLPGPAPVPSSVLAPAGGPPGAAGLHAEYWSNTAFAGTPHLVQTDPTVNVNFGFTNFAGFNAASPKAHTPVGDFALLGPLSARWTGTFTAPADGEYRLAITARGTARLYVDGALRLTHEGDLSTVSQAFTFTAGQPHDVRIEYAAAAESMYQGGQVRFAWSHAEDVLSPTMTDAVALARRSGTAVVVVRDYETEGADRPTMELPREQGQLIRRVARANPNTVVVIETGAPALTRTWEDGVPAILQAWYPGQEQGSAIADVLFGDANPGGKLPVTFPTSDERTPISSPEQFPGVGCDQPAATAAAGSAQPPPAAAGTTPVAGGDGAASGPVTAQQVDQDCRASFSEGVFVGYRGHDQLGIAPQYPFGHGLSFTRFGYGGLSVAPAADGAFDVSFNVQNVGGREGDEVAQVYVGRLPGNLATPPRQLAGFERVSLARGERQRVTVNVSRRSLSTWDPASHSWLTPAGPVRIMVGSSSRDIRLVGSTGSTG
jgi:beta-glucosidase